MSEQPRPISAAAGRRQVSVACEAFNAEVAVPQNATANIEGFIARGSSVRSACRITGFTLARFSMNVNLSHDRAPPILGLPFCPAGTASVSLPLALPLVQHLFRARRQLDWCTCWLCQTAPEKSHAPAGRCPLA